VCDLDQFVCTDPAPVAASKLVSYRTDLNSFYLNGAALSSAQVTLDVSSMVPSAGFVLRIDNSHKAAKGSVSFDTDGNRLGVYELGGTKITSSIDVAANGVRDVLVTFPDMDPSVIDANSWGYGAGYLPSSEGRVRFSALSATLNVMPDFGSGRTSVPLAVQPNVVNTDNYAFSAGVFENSLNLFVPYANDLSSFDAYYFSPQHGESYSGFLFSNVMLSGAYGLGLGTTSSQPSKIVRPGFNGISNLGSASNLDQTFYVWPMHINSVKQTSHRSSNLTLARSAMAFFADPLSTGGGAVAYSAMSSKASRAMVETASLRKTYSDLGKD
jgi:hypothetical protein